MTKPIKVKMFTKTICPTCKVAKQQLSFLPVDVDIEEINIDTDSFVDEFGARWKNSQDYLTDVLDSMSTPTFEFESGRVIRGYNEGEIREELGL
ncbi:glutaredoxin family protein [Bacillus cereus]|uniref:glutaredoxin family protein n=1 Tax=Bacillus cereus TaxID=1396 RepID=UPI003D95DF0F